MSYSVMYIGIFSASWIFFITVWNELLLMSFKSCDWHP